MKRAVILILGCFFLVGCIRNKKNTSLHQNKDCVRSGTGNTIKYARGFVLERHEKYTYIAVFNPWDSKDTLATYILTNDKTKIGQLNFQFDFILEVPVRKVALLSYAYIGMFASLNERDKISAVSNPKLIYDSVLYDRYKKSELFDPGESSPVNSELIIGHSPDLLVKYIYKSKDQEDNRIIEAGIPVAYILEFMETHPLGRAEWIKLIGAFLDKEAMADSVFNDVESRYLHLCERTKSIKKKPSVMDGSSYKGIWHAAGGRSFKANFYTDAGADYQWKDDTHTGSIPLSFEVVIEKHADADFWIGPSSERINELLREESRYTLIKAFREKNVFCFTKRKNPNGGLDYFESGIVRPDLLLKDLIWVFHPELIEKDYKTVYLERIY